MPDGVVDPGHGARKLLPAWQAHERKLWEHLPYISLWGDAILLRDGDLMASLAVDGINAELSEDQVIEGLRQAFTAVINAAGDDIAWYIHRVSVPVARPRPHRPATCFGSEIDRRWQDHLASAGLMERRTIITVVIRPQALEKRTGFLTRWTIAAGGRDKMRARLDRRTAALEEVVRTLEAALAGHGARRLTVETGELLGFTAGLCNPDLRLLGTPCALEPLSLGLTDQRVIFREGRIALTGASERVGAILSIKRYGAATWPGVFSDFDLPVETVVTSSFTPTGPTGTVERMRRIMRQMRASDDMAVSLREEIAEAADDVESGRALFGHHHLTVAVYAPDGEALDRAISELRKAGQSGGAILIAEDFGARAAWFAQHPGNFRYRARAAMISSTNFVDMAALHARPPGRDPDATPWGKILAEFPTPASEIYRLNLHAPGQPKDEPTPGHTLIVGKTGSGKTLLTIFLIAQALERGVRVFAFDKDQGLEMGLRALGGDYTSIKTGQSPGLNPFASEWDDRGIGWLTDWLAALLEEGRDPLRPEQSLALADAVRENAGHVDLRALESFAEQFVSLDDGGDLMARLSEWQRGGRFGWIFDHTGPDALSLEGDLVGVDMTEIMDLKRERMAVLSYLFRRIERLVEDRKPTFIVLDEAWKLLDDSYFAARLKDWMLTMRKKNAALVMLIQQTSHLEDSRAGRAIVENAATKLIFPNAEARTADYARIGLNEAEASLASSAISGRKLLVKSAGDSVLLDVDLSALGPALAILGGGAAGERLTGPGWRRDPEFWRPLC